MKLVENLIVALSMYSKIPMPHIEWTKENMRYTLCFFPVVGVAVGAVVRLWYDISVLLSVGVLLRTAILVLIPVLDFGRGGPLTLALALANKQNNTQNRLRYPEESMMIG